MRNKLLVKRQLQVITINLQEKSFHKLFQNNEIYQKMCSSNCKNLKARKNFLKISKPAEIRWGTPFVRNSSWGTLHKLYQFKNEE